MGTRKPALIQAKSLGALLRACARWLAQIAVAAVATAAALPAQASPADCLRLVPIDSAERSVWRDGERLDVAQVGLPDVIPRQWRNVKHQIRYTLNLPACDSHSPAQALLIHRVGAPYTITSEAHPLQPVRADAWAPGQAYNGRIGGVFALPVRAQTVQVSLVTLPNVSGGLIEVVSGPQTLVLGGPAIPHERWQQFFQFAATAIGLAGLISLLIWTVRRGEIQLFWFGTLCVLWWARGHLLQLFAIPWNPYVFEQLNPFAIWATSLLVATSTFATLHCLRGKRVAVLVLQAVGLVGGLAASLALPSLAGQYRTLSFAFGFVTLIWLVVELIGQRRNLQGAHTAWLATGFLAVLVGASHDLLMILGVFQPGWWSLLTPGFTVMLFCHLVAVGLYLLNALKQAENSKAELERAVSVKSIELEQSYNLLRASERASARAQERARFNREIHDGVGAQLITALRGVERGAMSKEQVAQTLQEGLDELRLLMDAADLGRSLHRALAAWRNRWDARLQAIGLDLHWEVSHDLEQLELGSNATLQVMRVLQEAVTNSVKHAVAQNVTVRAWLDEAVERALVLDIADNGRGLEATPSGTGGRGLRHMAQRAETLGGTLTVTNASTGGVLVRLRLPLSEPFFEASDTMPLMP